MVVLANSLITDNFFKYLCSTIKQYDKKDEANRNRKLKNKVELSQPTSVRPSRENCRNYIFAKRFSKIHEANSKMTCMN